MLFDLEAKEGRWLDAKATLGEAIRRGENEAPPSFEEEGAFVEEDRF